MSQVQNTRRVRVIAKKIIQFINDIAVMLVIIGGYLFSAILLASGDGLWVVTLVLTMTLQGNWLLRIESEGRP